MVNYIPELIRKSENGFKDKIVSLFKTSIPKKTVYGREKKLNKTRKQNIKKPFITKKERRKN